MSVQFNQNKTYSRMIILLFNYDSLFKIDLLVNIMIQDLLFLCNEEFLLLINLLFFGSWFINSLVICSLFIHRMDSLENINVPQWRRRVASADKWHGQAEESSLTTDDNNAWRLSITESRSSLRGLFFPSWVSNGEVGYVGIIVCIFLLY